METLSQHEDEAPVCIVPGCGRSRPRLRKGLCCMHYKRQRTGAPMDAQPLRVVNRPAPDRFWEKVVWTADGHWLWMGSRTKAGYGAFYSGERSVRAHRWCYERLIGPIPAGLQLDHLCRVPRCVNPFHLEPVTSAENTRRAFASRSQDFAPGTPPVPGATAAEMRVMRADAARVRAQQPATDSTRQAAA